MVKVAVDDQRQIKHKKTLPQVEIPHVGTARSIYPNILADSEVPQSEKELKRLEDDAIFLMMADTDAPAQALAITLFHIVNNSNVYDRLKEELLTIPDPNTVPTLQQFKKLPYLVSSDLFPGLYSLSLMRSRLQLSEKVSVSHQS
jgi:hypothetical protein